MKKYQIFLLITCTVISYFLWKNEDEKYLDQLVDSKYFFIFLPILIFVHECAHYSTLLAVGGKGKIVWRFLLVMSVKPTTTILGWRYHVVALAGPLSDLMILVVLYSLEIEFYKFYVVVAAWNLMPLPFCDGGKLFFNGYKEDDPSGGHLFFTIETCYG